MSDESLMDKSLVELIMYNMKLLVKVSCLFIIYHAKRLYARLISD